MPAWSAAEIAERAIRRSTQAGQQQQADQAEGGDVDRQGAAGDEALAGEQGRADRADARRLGRRRDAGQDRAQHRDDQDDRRDQRADEAAIACRRRPPRSRGIAGDEAGRSTAITSW